MQSKLIPIGSIAVMAVSAVAFAAETPGQTQGAPPETISVEGRVVPLRHYLMHGAEGQGAGAFDRQSRPQTGIEQRAQTGLDQTRQPQNRQSALGQATQSGQSAVESVTSEADAVAAQAQSLARDVSEAAQQNAAAVGETLDDETMKRLAGVGATGREGSENQPTTGEPARAGQRYGQTGTEGTRSGGQGLGFQRGQAAAGQMSGPKVGSPLVLIPKETAGQAAAGGEPYLLIFNPDQVTSLSALARGEAEPGSETEADRQLVRQPAGAQSQTDQADRPPEIQPERLRQRFGADAALTRTWRHDNEVRVTGRVIDRGGLRAIYVARVEKVQPEGTQTQPEGIPTRPQGTRIQPEGTPTTPSTPTTPDSPQGDRP